MDLYILLPFRMLELGTANGQAHALHKSAADHEII